MAVAQNFIVDAGRRAEGGGAQIGNGKLLSVCVCVCVSPFGGPINNEIRLDKTREGKQRGYIYVLDTLLEVLGGASGTSKPLDTSCLLGARTDNSSASGVLIHRNGFIFESLLTPVDTFTAIEFTNSHCS
jgi:hypothetical protein